MLKFLGHEQGEYEIDQYAQGNDAYQDILQRGVHTFSPSSLQALAALGETDERDKRDNRHYNDNQIKHGVPPH